MRFFKGAWRFGLIVVASLCASLSFVGCNGDLDCPVVEDREVGSIALDSNYEEQIKVNNDSLYLIRISAAPTATTARTDFNSSKFPLRFVRELSLVAIANATSCPEPGFIDRITSVAITSDTDFSPAFPAGADLSSLFSGTNTGQLLFPSFSFLLDSTPTEDSVHRFSVTISLDTGKSFSFQTQAVEFVNQSSE